MGVVYVGNCEIEPIEDFVLDEDLYGLGRLTRTFRGRADKLAQFLKLWPKGKTDATLKQFKLSKRTSNGEGPFVRVTLEFNGLVDGKIPDPIKSGGTRQQTVSLQMIDGNQTCEVEYKAPFSVFRYVSTTLPKKARFDKVILQTDAAWDYKNLRGDKTTPFFRVQELSSFMGNIRYTNTQPGKFNYARVVSSSGPQFQQVGEFYEVEEVNEGLMIDVARNDLPRIMLPGDYTVADLL